jgi:hypothetical protein
MKSILSTLVFLFFVSASYCQLFNAAGNDIYISDGSLLSSIEPEIINNGEFIGDSGDGVDTNDGEVVLNATISQTMSGPGNYENLRIENTVGVLVNHTDFNDPIDINGLLTVNGIFNAGTGNFVRLPCIFPGINGRNAQVGVSSGTISGITVQQCFPGRRAFRFISSSTGGARTIHEEWQEGLDEDGTSQGNNSYLDNFRPNFGTHITGLGEVSGSGHSSTPGAGDQFQGLDWQPSGNASMFRYNESATPQAWENVENTEVPLVAGEPFLINVRGSRAVDITSNISATSPTTLESTGDLETGPVTITPTVNASGDGVFVGNPYHSIVDLTQVNIGAGYDGFAYIFDPNLGGIGDTNTGSNLGGRGGYVTINLSSGASNVVDQSVDVNTTNVNRYLQPYQAFFLITTTGTPGSITFNEADKAVDQPQTDVFNSSQSHIFVNLFDKESFSNQSTADDGLVIYFSPNGNNSADNNDAQKFVNPDEMIARNENGNLISFENRAMPTEDDVLKLYTDQYRTTDYVLEIGVQFLEGNTVYLYDRYTETETLLEQNVSNFYNFSVNEANPESTATDRFKIVFSTTTMGTDDFGLEGISVYPNPASDILNIGLEQNIGRFDTVKMFDISGRLVINKSLSSQLQQVELDVNTLSSGVYVLQVSSDAEQLSTKVIVE